MTEVLQNKNIDTRQKNALTVYEVADLTDSVTADSYEGVEWKRLGKWIPTINNESEDIVNEAGYYDGDGTAKETVDGMKERYTFEGMFDPADEAQALIASKKNLTGVGRNILLRITDPDGNIETGLATVTNIKFRGGVATEYAPFNCTISRDAKPTITPAA